MSHYFVNNAALPDGNHEVHSMGCRCMPVDKRYLGDFETPADAMIEARKDFSQASTCEKCGDGRRIESTSISARFSVDRIRSMLGKAV